MRSWSRHQKLQEEFLFSGDINVYTSVYASVCCHNILITAPEIARGEVLLSVWVIAGAMKYPGHGTRNCKRRSWGFDVYTSSGYINVYVCSPVFYLTGPCWIYIYIMFCVLLIVLCFIMFLLSWERSLGRCF